jgi:hypothetical protein
MKFRIFVDKLMNKNPYERPTATEAIEKIVCGGQITANYARESSKSHQI